jgi:hypothetical protein
MRCKWCRHAGGLPVGEAELLDQLRADARPSFTDVLRAATNGWREAAATRRFVAELERGAR